MSGAPRFLEFFAGGGLARLGLEGLFDCVFANDIDAKKCAAYRLNFSEDHLVEGDVGLVDPATIPAAEMAWASFPCQDLSLAGARRGLNAPRSGAFWAFWKQVEALDARKRAPAVIAMENVAGLLTSSGGQDFATLCGVLANANYTFGAVVLDAAHFTPQSRPRLFLIARKGKPPASLCASEPNPLLHPQAMQAAVTALPGSVAKRWVWWRLPPLPKRNLALADVIERDAPKSTFKSAADLKRLLSQMAPLHRARVEAAKRQPRFNVGAVFRRIRIVDGVRMQRAEIRYDGLAGCLRTPAGGSSRQLLILTEGGKARLRLLAPREAARLMGAPETYRLPTSDTAGLKLFGDAVCAPAVRWLGEHLLLPLATARAGSKIDRAA
jgi:DNA (cytosine-5)-methyltransferase 1